MADDAEVDSCELSDLRREYRTKETAPWVLHLKLRALAGFDSRHPWRSPLRGS